MYSMSPCLVKVQYTSQRWAFGSVLARVKRGADQPELLRSSLAADHTLPPPLVHRSCCEETQVEVNTPGFLSTLSVQLFLCISFCCCCSEFPKRALLIFILLLFKYRLYTRRLASILAGFWQCFDPTCTSRLTHAFLNNSIHKTTQLWSCHLSLFVALSHL